MNPIRLKKHDGTEVNPALSSFTLSSAECVDKIYQYPVDLKASELEGTLTITAQATVHGEDVSDFATVNLPKKDLFAEVLNKAFKDEVHFKT